MDSEIFRIIAELAKAAHALEARGDESTCVTAGQAFEAALWRLETAREGRAYPEKAFPTRGSLWFLGWGWHSWLEIFGALARVDGGGYGFGPIAHPHRLRTPLLTAFVAAAKENGHPWQEGVEELRRRVGIKWKLRDFGLWPMPEHRLRMGSSGRRIGQRRDAT
jgi:hypothetical protein